MMKYETSVSIFGWSTNKFYNLYTNKWSSIALFYTNYLILKNTAIRIFCIVKMIISKLMMIIKLWWRWFKTDDDSKTIKVSTTIGSTHRNHMENNKTSSKDSQSRFIVHHSFISVFSSPEYSLPASVLQLILPNGWCRTKSRTTNLVAQYVAIG